MSDVDDRNEEDTQDVDDDEYDIEETYVVLDLGRDTPTDVDSAGTKYQLVGMDTETPYLRFGDAYYKGIIDQTIGTEMVFQTEGGNIKHIANTSRRVTFTRATVSLKNKAAYALAVRPIKFHNEAANEADQEAGQEAEAESGQALETDSVAETDQVVEVDQASNGLDEMEDTPMQDAQDVRDRPTIPASPTPAPRP